MKVWIDATSSNASVRVFGMSLLERILRGLALAARETKNQNGVRLSEIRVALPAGAPIPADLPADLCDALPMAWVNDGAPLVSALADALADAASEAVLVLSADSIIDTRLFEHLLRTSGNLAFVCGAQGERAAALRIEPPLEPVGADVTTVLQLADSALAASTVKPMDERAFPGYIRKLRRSLPPYVFRVSGAGGGRRFERFLFRSNYKGSTDFMTKYVYPPLVWRILRPLARYRVHPNWVSGVSVVLTFAAIPLFAMGMWVEGLILAYTMSVLDSVDGKLARTTFRASKLGNVLDHGLDLIHPPMWYVAWAWALGGGDVGSGVFQASIAWTVWYVLDRGIAQGFKRRTNRSIHAIAPLDVRMRTFISRRNVNLPLFTVALPLGLGIPAFYLMAAWQVVSALFHLQRLVKFWNYQQEPTPGQGERDGAPQPA
ncbi:MAG: CDP-alcohol phosphatidyltransferase family protein [Proteobacteria bacterium]|nr:CDP-alcohol phosphatidyltransferase family protein [Pseudomonadota bacterium]